eukprot:5796-Heterococcus_DN1.PRE.2
MAAAARLLNAVFDEPADETKQLIKYVKKGFPCDAQEGQEPHRTLLHLVVKLTGEREQRNITRALIKGHA